MTKARIYRVARDGKTYAVRGGKLIEIVSTDVKIGTKTVKVKLDQRFIGFPLAYLVEVYRCISRRSSVPIIVAILIYHRTVVCRSQTVTLPGAYLAEFRIDRAQKSRALALLTRIGLIQARRVRGQTSKVTLLWEA